MYFIRRILDDHLKDGKYANPCEQLYEETVSVNTINSIAERNFGMLDRLIREKPNANIIKYEAINMNRRNKTSEWRKTLSPEKRSLMMKWARQYASKQYQLFKQRRTESRKAKNEKRLDKIEEARRKECRNRLIKERLCAEISQYGGVWLKEEQIDAKLAEMRTDSEKHAALKCQLQFRQKVISVCPSNDRKLFFLLKKGHLKSVQELTDNLKNLLRQLKNDKTITKSSLESNLPIVLSETKLLEEKDRLRSLCHKEVEKLLKKKKEEPQTKRKKANEDALLNIPIVTSVDELVGKRVQHLTFDYDGKEKWFPGVVVCQKPDSDTELVIRYDCEDKLYSFNFSDFKNSVVKLISVKLTDFLGKRIRQRFTNIEENDFW